MTRVAVIQSNYLPWKGYFDTIRDADVFVFYDCVQYTKNDWRNRNRIKSTSGPLWLTVPVSRCSGAKIHNVEIQEDRWQSQHWKTIKQYYSKAPAFEQFRPFFEDYLLRRKWTTLSELNQFLTRTIAEEFLGIQVEFLKSSEFELAGHKQDRLMDLLRQVNATTYISGPAAKAYIDEQVFREAGIELIYKSYDDYPEYPQMFPPFVHEVSIVDLLLNTGSDAQHYIWGYRDE